MRVLVTGGAGFIGSNLVDRLLEDGHEVAVVDDLSTGKRQHLERASTHPAFSFEELDLALDPVGPLLASLRPEVVCHLAAQSSVGVSVGDPARDARTNVLGSLQLLQAAVRTGVSHVVYAASGGTLYRPGPEDALPLTESTPRGAESPYGISKAVVLDYLEYFGRQSALTSTALALANVYGPRQDAHGESGVVAIFSDLARRGLPLRVNGDGEQTRDFVHVEDVVDAFARAVELRPGGLINVGTGAETSINTIAQLVAQSAPAPIAVEHGPEKPGEVRRSALSPARAEQLLGWRPRRELAEGIASLVVETALVGTRP